MLSQEAYLLVLNGLEKQLMRWVNASGNLLETDIVQDLQRGWCAMAKEFRADYPETPLPVPFWEAARHRDFQARLHGMMKTHPRLLSRPVADGKGHAAPQELLAG